MKQEELTTLKMFALGEDDVIGYVTRRSSPSVVFTDVCT